MVITTAQLPLTKPELRFCTSSNHACGGSENCVSLTMLTAGNKTKRLSPVSHPAKTIHQFIITKPMQMSHFIMLYEVCAQKTI